MLSRVEFIDLFGFKERDSFASVIYFFIFGQVMLAAFIRKVFFIK